MNIAEMLTTRDDCEMMVGRVVTFNALPDYVSRHTDEDPIRIEGQVGFVCEYVEQYSDAGDPENGPRLVCDSYFDVYVPALRRSIPSDPCEWSTAVEYDWYQAA